MKDSTTNRKSDNKDRKEEADLKKKRNNNYKNGSVNPELEEILSDGIATNNIIGWAREYNNVRPDQRPQTMFQGHSLPVAVEENRKRIRNSQKMEQALELSPSMVLILDRWGNIEYANPRFMQVTGFTKFELNGKDVTFLASAMTISPDLSALTNAIQKGREWKGEISHVKKGGGVYYFSGKLNPIENEYDFITGFILTGEDVTAFRQTQEQLIQTLEEKNVILAELHHRVKNNLAIVSGLMQLQAFNEPDEHVQDRLYSSAGRVKSLASMHEVLYESKNLTKIEIAPILTRIIDAVEEFYKNSNSGIDVTQEIGQITLNVNQAHPCALILNEIISNAYKHAFEKYQKGHLTIRMYEEDEMVFLSVSDNGKGFSEDYQEIGTQMKTTGYELLNTLVGQLDGEFKYESDEGKTVFLLCFKKEDANGASNANLIR